MKTVTVLEYLKMTNLLDRIEKETFWTNIPLTIDGLMDLLEDCEFNYWSYSTDDVDEIKNPDITVLVSAIDGERYFELEETETW